MFFNWNEKRCFKIILFLLLPLFISLSVQISHGAQEEFIALNEINPGMQGIGKTVFSGTKIESFDVHVIDIIPDTNLSNPYILVRLSGEKIDENGGISAGMSGSPVYFDGKLAGAVSHSWEMSEHNLCLITPINRMLPLLDYTKEKAQSIDSVNFIDNFQEVSICLDKKLQKNISQDIPSIFENNQIIELVSENQTLHFQTIQSPILISGFEGRACEILEEKLLERGAPSVKKVIGFYDVGDEIEIGKNISKIDPGSAIGVQLSAGDASLLTIGTATYCKNFSVLAFGHPFMHLGDVSYLFSAVYIYHSFPSLVMPFKVGSPYLLLGEVVQDRDTGILAKLNQFPRIVSCKIYVQDLDRDFKIQSGTKVVPQSDFLKSVISSLSIQSIDRTIDRIGQGTAMVHLKIKASQSGKEINHENIFFNKDDIALQCSEDLEEMIDLLANNYNEYLELSEIQIDIKIKEQNQSAIIKEVKIDQEYYIPGDTIKAQIFLKSFRKPDEIEVAEIKLPDDIPEGEAILIIRGGATPEVINDRAFDLSEEDYLLDGWIEIQDYLNQKEKNNQIISELLFLNESEKLTSSDQENEQNDHSAVKKILNTDFVVEGYHEMFLHIQHIKEQDKVSINE